MFELSMSKYIISCFKDLSLHFIDDLESCSWLEIIHWFKLNNSGLKNSPINKIMKFWNTVLKYSKIINPLRVIEKLKDATQGYDVATYDTMRKIYDYIFSLIDEENNLLYKLIISLLRDTGCRRNELLNLKFSNIQYNPNIIVLDITKNGKKE